MSDISKKNENNESIELKPKDALLILSLCGSVAVGVIFAYLIESIFNIHGRIYKTLAMSISIPIFFGTLGLMKDSFTKILKIWESISEKREGEKEKLSKNEKIYIIFFLGSILLMGVTVFLVSFLLYFFL